MDCSICKDLEQAFEYRCRKYIEARFAAYYQVSTELAAYKNVDMERAKSNLQEHQLVCVSAASVSQSEPGAAMALTA
jgi:Zn-dependent peptidase ImmA (M78 family)